MSNLPTLLSPSLSDLIRLCSARPFIHGTKTRKKIFFFCTRDDRRRRRRTTMRKELEFSFYFWPRQIRLLEESARCGVFVDHKICV